MSSVFSARGFASYPEVPSRGSARLTAEEKRILVSVYLGVLHDREQPQSRRKAVPEEINSCVARLTGINKSTVAGVVSTFKEEGVAALVTSTSGGKISLLRRPPKIPSDHVAPVVEFIRSRHATSMPTTARVIRDLYFGANGVNLSLRTVQNFLKNYCKLSFKRSKKGRDLFDSEEAIQERATYVRNIRRAESDGLLPVYTDESFIHHHHKQEFSWFGHEVGNGYDKDKAKGARYCFLHAVSREGLVPGAWEIFEAKAKKPHEGAAASSARVGPDYHKNIDHKFYLDWLRKLCIALRALGTDRRFAIVIDQASIHLTTVEGIAFSSLSNKEKLRSFLQQKGVEVNPAWKVVEMKAEAKKVFNTKLKAQEIAEEYGFEVIVLPVHQPVLNPIEEVWREIKNHAARHYRTGITLTQVKKNLEDGLKSLEANRPMIESFFRHSREWEDKMALWDLEDNSDDSDYAQIDSSDDSFEYEDSDSSIDSE